MDLPSMRRRWAQLALRRRIGSGVATWLLCFGSVLYLGLNGGGYDLLVSGQLGIAVWWVLIATVAVGVLPSRSPGTIAWLALGLLAAFAVWTALSLDWTESAERTSVELARVATYLGVFAIAVFSPDGEGSRRTIGAVGAAIFGVSLVALLSRLHPAWFPGAEETANLVSASLERLSYPLNYWNGLGGLVAMGMPLMLQIATGSRSVAIRAAAAAALPALALTIFFTLSRGGIAAAIVALAIFLAFSSDRLPKALALLLTGAGGAILIVDASHRDALQHGFLGTAARQQGDEMLTIVLAVCLVVGLIHAAVSYGLVNGMRPRWTLVSRRNSYIAAGVAVLVTLVVAGALDAPGRAADGWDEFKRGGEPGSGVNRLGSVAGQSRYQLWQAALDENGAEPLTGTGAGTFEFWWTRHNSTGESVRDTHSLYLQTLGELGIVGLLLLLAFLVVILVGAARVLGAAPPDRSPSAAALAGFAAFCITAVFDWMWQLPVLPVAALLLGSVLVLPPGKSEPLRGLRLRWRIALGATALAAIVAIAIPLASTDLVRSSEAAAREGDLATALEDARTAQNVQPDAASPRLQEALVLERQGDFASAVVAARAATEREQTNWRTWLVRSRVEAENGEAAAAVRDYRRARSLNPHSPLFER